MDLFPGRVAHVAVYIIIIPLYKSLYPSNSVHIIDITHSVFTVFCEFF